MEEAIFMALDETICYTNLLWTGIYALDKNYIDLDGLRLKFSIAEEIRRFGF